MIKVNNVFPINTGAFVPPGCTYQKTPCDFLSYTFPLRGGLESTHATSTYTKLGNRGFTLKSFSELSDYYTYTNAKEKFKTLAENFSSSIATRALVINFLSGRESKNDIIRAIALIKGLTELKRLGVEGTKRVLLKAYKADLEGKCTDGYLTEVNTALSLIENSFTVHSLSVSQITYHKKKIDLRSQDGIRREIDIIASKDLGSEIVPLFIEVKNSSEALEKSIQKNDQIAALVEIAERFNAVPVVILKTSSPFYLRNGNINYRVPLKPRKDIVINLLAKYTKLLAWDQNGTDLVSESEILT